MMIWQHTKEDFKLKFLKMVMFLRLRLPSLPKYWTQRTQKLHLASKESSTRFYSQSSGLVKLTTSEHRAAM